MASDRWQRRWERTTSPATTSELLERLGLPSRLATLGVEQADLEAVARLSQALQPAVSWDEDTVAEVLSAAL